MIAAREVKVIGHGLHTCLSHRRLQLRCQIFAFHLDLNWLGFFVNLKISIDKMTPTQILTINFLKLLEVGIPIGSQYVAF